MDLGDLRGAFTERGYLTPLRLFSQRECQVVLARLREEREQGGPLDWGKGWAATSSGYYTLAAHDRILDLVRLLIGDDVLLWGATLVVREPGEAHPWHTDIESSSQEGGTIAAWIGLGHTTPRSSLKVVPFSHRFGVTLQQVSQETGVDRLALTDDLVASWASERDRRSGVVPLEAADGDVVLFDGRLWHGSYNLNRRDTRYAALLQYATPRTPIRIPNLDRLVWPFESYQAPKAPCIVVSGRAVNDLNRLVSGPAATGHRGIPALTTRIHSLQLPLEQDPNVGWKPHFMFRGATPNLEVIGCHASVLDPDRQPHPPHRHYEEEILIVLDGQAELVLEDAGSNNQLSRRTADRGVFAYYPSGFAHTIRNTSDAPVTYLMFKWAAEGKENAGFLEHHLIPIPEAPDDAMPGDSAGFSPNEVLEGETKCLRRLHSHVTTLQPGAGYAPHVDAHDVAIVMLEGTVETLGERVGPDSVIFYAAGEPHGMQNVGDIPAVYLVFEFHGRHLAPRVARRKSTRSVRSLVEAARRRLRFG